MIQSQELWNPILNQLLRHTWKFVHYNAENSLVYETFTGRYESDHLRYPHSISQYYVCCLKLN